MNKVILYAAVLIGLFLVVIYYRGASSVISSGGGVVSKMILFLQGRDSQGQITNYPQ